MSSHDDAMAKLSKMFEASQKSNSKSAKDAQKLAKQQLSQTKDLAQMEDSTRRELAARQQQADAERQAADIQARLQITDKEQAAAMARLEKDLQVRREDMENQLTMSRERLGFDREQLAANVQTERDKLAQAREEMEKIGIPKMLADKWYQEQQVTLAQSAQKIDEEKVGVDRGRLGFDVFSKAVELASSPATRYQFGDFAEGLAKNGDAIDWLKSMSDQTARSGFGAPPDAGTTTVTPEQAMAGFLGMLGVDANGNPLTAGSNARVMGGPDALGFGSTLRVMGGPDAGGAGAEQAPTLASTAKVMAAPGGATTNYYDPAGAAAGATEQAAAAQNPALARMLQGQQQELAQIGQVADKGAGALAPGALENLGPEGLQAFTSGLKKLRRNVPQWMSDYQKTRVWNTGGPELAAA